MAIGQRIKFFRNRKGFTQKQLGEMLGFHGKSSDVRMAQYESEARIPKQELIKEMADRLEVDTKALTVPNIDNYLGLMHTFFTFHSESILVKSFSEWIKGHDQNDKSTI